MARVVGPEAAGLRRQRLAGVGELERANNPPAVVRMHDRGGCRVPFGEGAVGGFGSGLVVEAPPTLARPRPWRRREPSSARAARR